MEKVSQHFALISAALSLWITAVVLSFFGAFLDAFNTDLMQLVDYSDILKLDIEAFSLIAPLTGVGIYAYIANTQWKYNSKLRYFTYFISALIIVILAYSYALKGEFPRMHGVATLLLIASVYGWFARTVENWKNTNTLLASIFATLFSLIIARSAGSEYADYVRSKNEVFQMETGAKGKFVDDLQDLKLIITLSNKTVVLRKNTDVLVISNDDITSMTLRSKPDLSNSRK